MGVVRVLALELAVIVTSVAWVDIGAQARSVDTLAWISGCWEGQASSRRYREQWMRPDGGAMLGMSQTVSGGKMVAHEFLQIREEPDGVYYVAKPSGQQEASFKLTAGRHGEAVFENPQHDFPQRIIYKLESDGGLVARTEGTEGGSMKSFDFVMRRARCE